MTIRDRLTVRFAALVSSILLLTFVSIYAFCWYFTTSDFYRRLDRKAATIGDMLIRHQLDADLIQQLNRIRRDQLPSQNIMIYDGRDSLVFSMIEEKPVSLAPSVLADIRQSKQRDFRQGQYYVSGSRYVTANSAGLSGPFVVVASAENRYGEAFLRWLRWALLGFFGLTIGITALAGHVFASDALRPMQQIDQTLGHIFPQNQEERLPVRTEPDEISRLSTTINGLLDRVAESLRLQRLFVANVSHELKNPLTRISSQLEVSLLNQRDPETYRQTIRSVLEDIMSLSNLTHDLLQLSQTNQRNALFQLTDTVRIDELAWDIRDAVMALHPHYRVTIELDTLPDDPDELTLPGNKSLLHTALMNLAENACKFSDDGHALIHVGFARSGVSIDVQNNGRPIPVADQPYIFEPFYRSHQRQPNPVQGYGVGLSLVERIVQLHGGQINVRSAPDVPTTFHLRLPR